jgi:hypothetical protein
MTEVKETTNAGLALYATQEYKPGELILNESPLMTVSPKTTSQITAIRSQFQNIKTVKTITQESPIGDLDIPSSIAVNDRNAFRQMLLAVASFALLVEQEQEQKQILTLYHPNLQDSDQNTKEENLLIQLSKEAFTFLQRQCKPSTKLSSLMEKEPTQCLQIMLIYRCNAFKGGNIYENTSRINHSCDFNAVVSTDPFAKDDSIQMIRAVSLIRKGEGIYISYLGSFTFADVWVRNERLKREKFFECQCRRCELNRKEGDLAGSVPCFKCHPREGRYLEEDVQYDDGALEVNYCAPCVVDASKNKMVYKCGKCGIVECDVVAENAMEKAMERVISHLEDGLMHQSEIDDQEDERAQKIEMTERLACLATSVLGAKHWASNLLLFVNLSAKLSLLHATMLCKSVKGGKKKEDDDAEVMNDIAECIDSLERVIAYVESLSLKCHFGHLVGNVCVGVARVLVGFGDIKSMKYGSSFAERVYDDYFRLGFEGEGMEKVVDTLIKKNSDNQEEDRQEPQKKKLKVKYG